MFVLCLAVLVFGAGCGTVSYYSQALRGQCQMLRLQKPISKLLADTNSPPRLRERLELALAIRHFAEAELHLPANGHYLHYADLKRPYAVWSVEAAPEFSLRSKSWWYPVVGRLEYRGYFDAGKARRYASQLAARGMDAHVGGVEAYSTLGWFRDPLLNTFLFNDELDLAELLFHELAHQRLFIAGDTDFNEAFATAAGQEGVKRWLRSRGEERSLAAHRGATERKRIFLSLVAGARAELATLYAAAPEERSEVCVCDLRREKQAVFDRLRVAYAAAKIRWGGSAEYDGWFRQPLNNAVLNTVDTYHALVPGFERLLAEREGDLEKLFREATALGKLDKEERRRRLLDVAP